MRHLPLLVSAVLLAGSGCSAGSDDDGERVVPIAGTVDLAGDETEVVLPSGRFTFTVAGPRELLAADEAADRAEHEAPDGMVYVGLGWAQAGAGPAPGPILHGTTPRAATVQVRAGESVVADVLTVDIQQSSGEGAWVLVPEDLDGAVAEIVYDGHTQRLDLVEGTVEPGAAQGLYDVVQLPTDCPDALETGAALSYSIDCTTSEATATPYVAGVGWAEEGAGWLVLDLALRPSPFRWSDGHRGGRFTVEAQTGELGPAEVLLASEPEPDGYAVTVAIPATVGSPTDLPIVRTYDLVRSGAGAAPLTTSAEYAATLHLPALPGKDD